ncbi:partner of Y14 and mago [Hydra vulgaris]|nr:partner of Y14 and mago isoform X1 [Hydra vulgaris]XP_047137266.1 partner of Y14 and mago isoform X2 [Hydra vulgaris]
METSGNVIAASQRPDGTWRKERKVKVGFVPQDEIQKYESRTKKFFSEKPEYPPGYNAVSEKPLSKNQKKNERKKQKREVQHSAKDSLTPPIIAEITKTVNELSLEKKPNDSKVIETVDRTKKIKALNKKIKQIEQLEEKLKKGEVLEDLQLEKISKKKKLEEELKQLQQLL